MAGEHLICHNVVIERMTQMKVSKTFLWYARHGEEIRRYAGYHVAIVNEGIAAVGKTAEEAYKRAKRKYPEQEPALTYIPKADILAL